jgi:hypothetical protein
MSFFIHCHRHFSNIYNFQFNKHNQNLVVVILLLFIETVWRKTHSLYELSQVKYEITHVQLLGLSFL